MHAPGGCRDGYALIMACMARHQACISFTCVEMRDCEHPPEGRCSPQGLLSQVSAPAALPAGLSAGWRVPGCDVCALGVMCVCCTCRSSSALEVTASPWLAKTLCNGEARQGLSPAASVVALRLQVACFCVHCGGRGDHALSSAWHTMHCRYDDYAFERIAESAFGRSAVAANFQQVTFLRMGDLMFDHWPAFKIFLKRMTSS